MITAFEDIFHFNASLEQLNWSSSSAYNLHPFPVQLEHSVVHAREKHDLFFSHFNVNLWHAQTINSEQGQLVIPKFT